MNNKYIDNKLQELKKAHKDKRLDCTAYDEGQECCIEKEWFEQFIKEALSQQQEAIANQLLQDGHGGGNFRRLIMQLKSEQEECICLVKRTGSKYGIVYLHDCLPQCDVCKNEFEKDCQKPEGDINVTHKSEEDRRFLTVCSLHEKEVCDTCYICPEEQP